jgi:hypothetical protein
MKCIFSFQEFLEKSYLVTDIRSFNIAFLRRLLPLSSWSKVNILLFEITQNGFQEFFPTPIQSVAEVCICTRGLFWRKCSLNNRISEMKWWGYILKISHTRTRNVQQCTNINQDTDVRYQNCYNLVFTNIINYSFIVNILSKTVIGIRWFIAVKSSGVLLLVYW